MEKPDFNKMAQVFETEYEKIIFEHELDEDPIKRRTRKLEKTWDAIIEYQSSQEFPANFYYYPDIQELIDLCNDYDLSEFYADLRFIAFDFKFKLETSSHYDKTRTNVPQSHLNKIEVLSAVAIFNKYKDQISLNLVRKQKVIGSIQNKELIGVIQSAVFEYFKNEDLNIKFGFEKVESSPEYYEDKIKIEKSNFDKFVTYEKHKSSVIKHCVYILWIYLLNYTHLKPKDGSEYSNEQGRFIFRFLEIFDFINKDKHITKKEDVVGYYLRSYKKINPTKTVLRYRNLNKL